MVELSQFFVYDWPVYAIAFATIVVAAIAQATVGIGFGIVSAPILAVLDPSLVPGPLLVLAGLTSFMVMIRDRADIRFGDLGYALGGRVAASILGGLTASMLSVQGFMILFAGLILVALGLSVSGWRVRPTKRNMAIAGAASGYMGTITSVGTPPMAIVYQYSPGPEVRANMSAFLTLGALVSVLSLAVFGEFTWTDLLFTVKLLPALLIGFWLSGSIKRFTDRGWMRPAMLSMCALAATILIYRAVA